MGEKCTFEFMGYITELVIAPLPRDKAEHWLTRSKDDLIKHAYGSETEELALNNIDAAFLPGAKFKEGCELRKGYLAIRAANGDELKTCFLDGDEFDDALDEIETIDPATHLVDNSPTIIRMSRLSGTVTYNPENPVRVDDGDGEKNWYVFVTEAGTGPFVSNLFVDHEEVRPETDGAYESQHVWLNVPDGSGGVRQVYHSVKPR